MLMRLNLANLFAYRTNLVSSILGNIAWSTFGIVSMLLVTAKASHVLGWTQDELLIMAGCYHVLFSIFYILFSKNFQTFADTIFFGRLDSILTKPIDSQFFISCWQIGYTGVVRFVIGVGFLIYLFFKMGITINLITFMGFLSLLLLSVVILYSIWFSVLTITIWNGKLSNLTELLYMLNGIVRYPGEFYRHTSIFLYIFLFPFMVILTSPVKALLQKGTIEDILSSLVLSVVLLGFCRFFWKYALRHYTSASG